MSGSHIGNPPTPMLDSMMNGTWKIQAQLEKEIFLRTKAESLLDRQMDINDEINIKYKAEINSYRKSLEYIATIGGRCPSGADTIAQVVLDQWEKE